MKKGKLSRRITWRVIGIMSFFNVLIIGAILALIYEVSLGTSSTRGDYVTDGIVGNLETMLHVAKSITFNNRAEVEASLDSPDHVFDALENILQVNKQLIGCFVAFEPDYFKDYKGQNSMVNGQRSMVNGQRSMVNGQRSMDNGQWSMSDGPWFEAYAYYADSTHIERRQIGSAQHDYFNGAWYQQAISLDRNDGGYLSDLYYDDSVNSGIYCSYAVPVFNSQGSKVGVYGVDLSLKGLGVAIEETMRSVKKEFLSDSRENNEADGKIYFSIQILDSKGNRITGTDSLDVNILKGEQKVLNDELEMKDLKGTPYYIHSKQLGKTGWTLVVLQHRELVFWWGLLFAAVIVFFMCIGCLAIFFFTTRSIRRATKPLGFLTESAQEVAKGNFNAPLPTFQHDDEVARLRDSFGTMQQSLKQYMEELKASTAAKASIESELNVAHSIQMSMIPKTFPAFPNRKDIELYASLTPAKAVGGDLYDFFILPQSSSSPEGEKQEGGKLFFCIGDVSGKGVPASLVMAVSRTLFRNISAHTDKPSHIVETMNANICEGNDECMFVTLFVGVLDLQTGHLRYCNAGHDAPYFQTELLPCASNIPIGLSPDLKYSEQEIVMAPGTTLFLYTDGLTEAMNARREQFGKQRINDVIASFSGSPQQLIETMIDAVHQFVGDTVQSDDLTMLAFKYLS
ncbi:MAG: SpoIIE family protein phosphatase [Prevotella sp.]|nr:SpoIIE family protein phosphatase [Prevotella sp.]